MKRAYKWVSNMFFLRIPCKKPLSMAEITTLSQTLQWSPLSVLRFFESKLILIFYILSILFFNTFKFTEKTQEHCKELQYTLQRRDWSFANCPGTPFRGLSSSVGSCVGMSLQSPSPGTVTQLLTGYDDFNSTEDCKPVIL